MSQKGQVEILLLILVLGVILFSHWIRERGMVKEPEIKKESQIQKNSLPKTFTPQEKPLEEQKSKTEEIESQKEKIVATIPPERFNSQPKGELPSETRKTIISLETEKKANCRYGRVSGLSFDSMFDFFAQTNATSHSTEIGYLSEGEKYIFYVKCQDEFGNKNTDDFEISFSVKKAEDKTPPERRYLSPSGMLPTDTTQVELAVGTDEKAYCYYSTLSGKSFWERSGSFSPNETNTYHTTKIYNLTSENVYDYFVRCCDFFGNCNDGDALIRFGIGIAP